MSNGTSIFNGNEVINKINEIKKQIEDFAETIGEVNELVDDLMQNGELSAVNGSLGARLYSTWDENKANVKEFQQNFENWVAVISLVTATNEEFVVDATNVYLDKNNRVGTTSKTREVVEEGEMSASERLSNTSFRTWRSYDEAVKAGCTNLKTSREFARGGEDLEKYKTYDNYLKAMFDKYNK